MLLSEAIKLGSMLGPQLRDSRLVGPGNSSCALGAALLALGVDCHGFFEISQSLLYRRLAECFPTLSNDLQERIWKKNDKTIMTREEIANWIVANDYDCESIELTVQEHEHHTAALTA